MLLRDMLHLFARLGALGIEMQVPLTLRLLARGGVILASWRHLRWREMRIFARDVSRGNLRSSVLAIRFPFGLYSSSASKSPSACVLLSY